MSHWSSSKMMSFDSTLKSFSNRGARDIDQIPFGKQLIEVQSLIGLEGIELGCRSQAELLQVAQGHRPRFVEMAQFGLGELDFPHSPVPHLNSSVPICGICLYLSHNVALVKPDDGHRHTLPL